MVCAVRDFNSSLAPGLSAVNDPLLKLRDKNYLQKKFSLKTAKGQRGRRRHYDRSAK